MEINQQLVDRYGKTFGPGETIFQEGEEGAHMFIIQEGQVEILKLINGKHHLLATLEKGEFFGEMAIVSRSARTASARAAQPTQLLVFDRMGFQSMIEKNSKIGLSIIDKLCRRLQNANQQIQTMAQKDARSHFALNLFIQMDDRETQDAAQLVEELGLHLQMPKEEIKQRLEEYQNQGILESQGDQLVLKNKLKLRDDF